MVRSSFTVLVCLGNTRTLKPGTGLRGRETGPLAASRESLSPPGVLPVPWGALRGPFADGGVSFAWGPWLPRRRVSRGPLLPPYGWASLGETIPCGLCQIRVPPAGVVGLDGSGSGTGQVLGRDRFSFGSGSRGAPLGEQGRKSELPLSGSTLAWFVGRVVLGGWDEVAVFEGPESVLEPSGAVLDCQASCQAIQEEPRDVVEARAELKPGPVKGPLPC